LLEKYSTYSFAQNDGESYFVYKLKPGQGSGLVCYQFGADSKDKKNYQLEFRGATPPPSDPRKFKVTAVSLYGGMVLQGNTFNYFAGEKREAEVYLPAACGSEPGRKGLGCFVYYRDNEAVGTAIIVGINDGFGV